ncbi:MAG TPA: DUF6141 family protein [Candidatus Deferrimicrobium sp.]|nr:DUF6141 family protein [Candidatus Deferrimicrobium sp.]
MTEVIPESQLFHEEQKFRQVWLWAVVLLLAGLAWLVFIQQIVRGIPFGSRPAPDFVIWILVLVVGVGLVWLLAKATLTTVVTNDHVRLRFFPIWSRTIPLKAIKSVQARDYRPIWEYGGWGIRWSPIWGMAYNVSGNRGVQLVLTNGKKVLIGSQKADELEAAIRRGMIGLT